MRPVTAPYSLTLKHLMTSDHWAEIARGDTEQSIVDRQLSVVM